LLLNDGDLLISRSVLGVQRRAKQCVESSECSDAPSSVWSPRSAATRQAVCGCVDEMLTDVNAQQNYY